MLGSIKSRMRRKKRRQEWRERNQHNSTTCENEFHFEHVFVGNYTYGGLTVLDFGRGSVLRIGSFCSLASGVIFNLSGDHFPNHISTFPFKAKVLGYEMNEAASRGDILVGDDVWIGQNAVIMSGVTIGQGAVIGAGSVVTRDVSPYAIVGGVPAKLIRMRFSEELIRELCRVDYSKLTKDMIGEHLDDLYTDLHSVEALAWMPKKE